MFVGGYRKRVGGWASIPPPWSGSTVAIRFVHSGSSKKTTERRQHSWKKSGRRNITPLAISRGPDGSMLTVSQLVWGCGLGSIKEPGVLHPFNLYTTLAAARLS